MILWKVRVTSSLLIPLKTFGLWIQASTENNCQTFDAFPPRWISANPLENSNLYNPKSWTSQTLIQPWMIHKQRGRITKELSDWKKTVHLAALNPSDNPIGRWK